MYWPWVDPGYAGSFIRNLFKVPQHTSQLFGINPFKAPSTSRRDEVSTSRIMGIGRLEGRPLQVGISASCGLGFLLFGTYSQSLLHAEAQY